MTLGDASAGAVFPTFSTFFLFPPELESRKHWHERHVGRLFPTQQSSLEGNDGPRDLLKNFRSSFSLRGSSLWRRAPRRTPPDPNLQSQVGWEEIRCLGGRQCALVSQRCSSLLLTFAAVFAHYMAAVFTFSRLGSFGETCNGWDLAKEGELLRGWEVAKGG